MRRKTNFILLLLLTLVLVMGIWSTAALAVDAVAPSDTLEVSIKTTDGTTVLHTYDLAEMNGLTNGCDIAYSSIDSMPATVKTVGTGVYLEDLLDDVQKYTSIDVSKFSALKFKATDGASRNFSYDDLFGRRYYFPSLHEEGNGLNEDNEVTYDLGEGTLVKTMLSVTAEQERLPAPTNPDDQRVYYPERYTVLFGISKKEVADVERRTSQYLRGTCQMVIDMGSYSQGGTSVSGITLDQSTKTIAVGKKLQLTATVLPSTATDQAVSWSSSNAAVATVSEAGLVSGLTTGTAKITATSHENNAISASCTITVGEADSGGSGGGTGASIDVTGVALSKSQLTLAVGKEATLAATVSPSGATNSTVTWKGSDTGIATVDQNGVVKGVKEGVAKITATAGGFSAVCTVTVSNTVVKVTGIQLDHVSLTLAKGKQCQLKPTITPKAATNTTVLWSSDAPGVVSVDTAGLVTAKNLGTAVISVMTEDGNFKAQCTVTVGDTVFSDISGSWAKADIESMVNLGVISGYSDGTFQPEATITRAEFLTLLVRILEKTQNVTIQSGSNFTDTGSHWAKDTISTAVALGITKGYEDGKFGSDDAITREQIAVMLAKAAGYDENQTTVSFTDSGRISVWAVSAVSYTVNKGFFTGYADGSFGPAKSATRAEVASLLLRFYNSFNTK